jgi:hypothetical protein
MEHRAHLLQRAPFAARRLGPSAALDVIHRAGSYLPLCPVAAAAHAPAAAPAAWRAADATCAPAAAPAGAARAPASAAARGARAARPQQQLAVVIGLRVGVERALQGPLELVQAWVLEQGQELREYINWAWHTSACQGAKVANHAM